MNNSLHQSQKENAPSLLHNMISFVGTLLAAASFFAVTCLIVLDFFRGFRNPYLGILTYLIAPAFLMIGLSLIAFGVLRERYRRRRLKPHEVPEFPRIDLNIPRHRRTLITVVVISLVFLLMTAVGSYRTYEFTESVMFCGKTCHAIMKPEYTAYQQSPHARVKCVQCHIGPGATWFVKSKLSGAYQVIATLTGNYPRPIPTPIKNLRPARETCEQCHWPREFFGDAERTFYHFLPDEKNSPWLIEMLVKIGGGNPAFGTVTGIHWHMLIANKIEYIASDEQRQVIPWVRLTDRKGKVTVYQSTDNKLKPALIAAAVPRVIDCIDCHNRPTHIFHSPVDSVDLAIHTGRIDSTIPNIKKQAIKVLTKHYPATSEATRGIEKALLDFYKSSYAEFAQNNATLISRAIAEIQQIYRQNFFPAMKVAWNVYPDNIGHWDFPGCYRCHDGNHTSADGKTITHECTACHIIVAQGPPGKRETNLKGLTFKHPVDVGGFWKETKCSECHSGDLAE
jgi:hypothetical protein